jgi:predicted metalloprotease
MTRRLLALFLALLCAGGIAGCGGGDLQGLGQDAREEAQRIRERAEELRARAEKLADRIRRELDRIRRSVPSASRPQPATQGRTSAGRIDGFLTDVLRNVDGYWTRTLKASGVPEPRIGYYWVPPGTATQTGCGAPADDNAAFYCPNDDTIYIGQVFASRVWSGTADEFPGERAGYGRAVGDFGLAYVVAHEYAHNLQSELGYFARQPSGGTVAPLELQADCLAGVWGNAVYRAGELQPGDVEEAVSTALAVGDFEFGSAGHHGTPEERRDAWLLGFGDGRPADCGRYVPT